MATLPPPATVLDLVERFERNRDEYLSGRYNEAQVRSEFLDPFFEYLGWDVNNRQGYAEAYKDVIHEDSLEIGGGTKAPDYCFRVGGTRKFFVEAKKPSVHIATDVGPAFQLRRYAWSAKLPLSILTDFDEFAVYDCRQKPGKADKPAVARIKFITCKEYADRWDELYSTFSKDAVQKGSFDRYIEATRVKKGTTEVDDAFLEEIERWRDMLARNIALRNPRLSTRELNFAVQRTIDRLIFLRICEDRGIETYGRLQALMNGERVYPRLRQQFQDADDRYNSGLFHFQKEKARAEGPDELTLKLSIDDKVLKDIIANLYYPDSPYEFSVLPADILGQVYEQFLGKVIRLTAGHQAKVEEKPEVRKAGGVYYTPTYIVDYIVKNTVGKLLEGSDSSSPQPSPPRGEGEDSGSDPISPELCSPSPRSRGEGKGEGASRVRVTPATQMTPREASRLRILDPACGSGSFLLGAYQYLLNWHRDWYIKDGPEKHTRELYQGKGAEWRLTTAEKKRILLNNIYGVDIDSQAVEVTKLSLLLRVLEGENVQTLNTQLKLFHERALPDLASNIKCGNSLIGPDFYQGQQSSLFDNEEERLRINTFDWQAEFPEIMKAGGFDVVIGNPPYVRQESLSDLKEYFSEHYEAFDGVADLYAYFMERSVRLLREGGRFSFIVSSSFLRTTYGEPLRRALKKYSAVLRVVDFGGLAVFENAKDTYVCIPLLSKMKQPPKVEVARIPNLEVRDIEAYVRNSCYTIPHDRFSAEAWRLNSDRNAAVFAKIMVSGKPLGEYVGRRMFYGVKTGLNEAFVIDSDTRRNLIRTDSNSAELIKPLLGGEDIRRYFFRKSEAWLIFTRRGVDIDRYPAVREYLERWREDLTPKRDKGAKRGRKPGSYKWYEIQDDVAYYEAFDHPKIIFPDIAKGPRFCLDTGGHYLANTAYCLGTDDHYLLGVLNSRLFWFAIGNISIPFGIRAGEYRYRLIYQYMEKVPIRAIDSSNRDDKARYDNTVLLVGRVMDLHDQLFKAKTDLEKTAIGRQIQATDQQIDQLVYDLYGLTEEEVRIVEGEEEREAGNTGGLAASSVQTA